MTQITSLGSDLVAEVAVKALQEKKGLEIVRMDLRGVSGAITEQFVVCSGTSDRHVQALAKSVEEIVLKELKDKPFNKEGYQVGEWVLLDYVNVVVHVFQRDKRSFYNVEDLWGDAIFEKYEDLE